MRAARPSKVNPALPSERTAFRSWVRQQAQDSLETARDGLARAHHAMETTRQTLARRDDILHHRQAWRERQAEQAAARVPTAPQVAHDLVLITQNAPDMARFHYALEACGLSPCQRVLTERSDVETFVRRAATAAPLFVPRLIITECRIPGMETEEIVAAMRTVPAYAGIPLLLFSTLEAAEGRRWLQCGATAFVHKPRNWEALVTAVATMVHDWGGMEDSQNPALERAENGEGENDGARNSSS